MNYRYRYVTRTKKGRWQDSQAKAMAAAVKAKVARYDEANERIYLDVFTEIERGEVPEPTPPATSP